MAQSANERRAAQRRNARIQRANRQVSRERQTRQIDLGIRQAVFNARVNWANDVMSGRIAMPEPGTLEAKNLASLASYSAHGQADPRFEAAFSRYWYHFKEAQSQADAYEENDEMFPEEDDYEDSDSEE
jgi:hypothetical protein